MECYICSKDLGKGFLCEEHALELKEILDKRVAVIENPNQKCHCHICGEHEGRIIVVYKNYLYICDKDINEALENYSK